MLGIRMCAAEPEFEGQVLSGLPSAPVALLVQCGHSGVAVCVGPGVMHVV